MKQFIGSLAAAIILAANISSCGGNTSKTNNSDSTLTKIDTTINPADHTNAVASDSTNPRGAVGLDTVAGGKSTSSGSKDSAKHK